ncbi:MAG: DUF3303 domain-containing protein [Granulosicoccus sp.]|nr:DUF3303 domain-containing protein [Granulosicoccus sp.]
MQYIVVETFKPGCFEAVYRRFEREGRLLPEGLEYIDSWLTEDHAVCFQLMATEEQALLDTWTSRWTDLVDFEIFPLDGGSVSSR